MKHIQLPAILLMLFTTQVLAQACIIESTDDLVPIRMCQQNISIPQSLFQGAFCQPQIPDRTFVVTMTDSCPEAAYGVCHGAKAEGVAYEQSIHYYSDPSDAPVLEAYCTQISNGTWQALEPES
jgi:hypothetical protein